MLLAKEVLTCWCGYSALGEGQLVQTLFNHESDLLFKKKTGNRCKLMNT